MVHDSAHFAKSNLELLVLSILCRHEWQHKKSVFWGFLTRSDTNLAEKLLAIARSLKLWI